MAPLIPNPWPCSHHLSQIDTHVLTPTAYGEHRSTPHHISLVTGGEGRAGLGLRLSLALQSQLSLDSIMNFAHVLPHLSFLHGFRHLVEDGLDERTAGLSTRAQTYRPCPMCSLLDTDGCHPTHSTGASQKLDMHAGHASWRHELTASSDTARGIVQAKIDTYLIKLLINGSVLNNMLQHARLRNHPA